MKFVLDLFNNLNYLQKWLVVVIVSIVLFLTTAGVSYSLFSAKLPYIGPGGPISQIEIPQVGQVLEEDPSIPRTEPCPVNGALTTKQAREKWEKRRPLAVMIENHEEARPQSGLSSADIVYETVAEGGITRFMAVFHCNFYDVQVGPVRSARTYFLDWASEYDPLYAHVGGANTPGPANALGQISDYKIKSLNQFGIGFPTYWRDYQRLGRPVATEHTMYSSTDKLWAIGEKKGWSATDSAGLRWDKSFVSWQFKDPAGNSGQTTKITVPFWEGRGEYVVEWNYDSSCNCYKRKNGGRDHMDLNTNKQISPKNVVVKFQKEGRANDGYEGNVHLVYTNKGEGKVLVFQDGNVVEGKWVKPTRLSREKFVDKSGKEIAFIKGQIWLQTVPEGSNVTY